MQPKMKQLNRPSIDYMQAFIDYISYRQLIDCRLILDIPIIQVCEMIYSSIQLLVSEQLLHCDKTINVQC